MKGSTTGAGGVKRIGINIARWMFVSENELERTIALVEFAQISDLVVIIGRLLLASRMAIIQRDQMGRNRIDTLPHKTIQPPP